MADLEVPAADDASAEKAYAEAAASVPLTTEIEAEIEASQPELEPAVAASSVEFPAKAKRATPPKVVEKPAQAVEAPALPEPAPVAKKAAKRAVSVKPKPAALAPQPVVLAKAKPAKVKPTAAARVKAAPAKPILAPKPKLIPAVKLPTATQLKEKMMAETPQFADSVKKVAADTQAKAKQAFDKGSAFFGEYAEFAKGNVGAIVESSKILASGVQSFGSDLVAEGKLAVETATTDAKAFAAVKSPSDFFKLQSEIMRRNFDSAVALGTKNGEAALKLATDSFAPISGRVSMAVEKIKKAA